MLVSELIEELQGLDPNMIVVLSSDAEGNSYSPLEGIYWQNNIYVPDSSWSGQIALGYLTPELEDRGYTEDDIYEGDEGTPAVVLAPVN